MSKHSVVILIDHKGRDLMGAALIAHHLKKMGIKTHLEPLESWQSAWSGWKPSMIIFNHLISKSVCAFSNKLHKHGVLVGALLNEGLCLKDNNRLYHSEQQYPGLHCDLFLTWNKLHSDCLREHKLVSPPENAIPVGVPRFDFYKQPWSNAYIRNRKNERINVLVNTTFAIAHFYHRSEKDQAMLYAAMGDGKIAETLDYKSLIKAHHNGLNKLPKFLIPLLQSERFNITIRPHPREQLSFYQDFINVLPDEQKSHIVLNKKNSTPEAILNADIVLNCEDCTTSVESWISGRPTLTLTFDKNPVFFTPTYSDKAPLIDEPADLLEAIDWALAHPEQEEFSDKRTEYLNQWTYKVDGHSAERAAEAIQEVITTKNPSPTTPNRFSDIRRGAKLRVLRLLNEPSHARIQHIIKRLISGESKKQTIKYRDYLKAVRPSEAQQAKKLISKIDV